MQSSATHLPPGAAIINTVDSELSGKSWPTRLRTSKAALTAFTHALAKQVMGKDGARACV
jgi:NAD(P)-dependent dehydrogenase (short-subunit alcohol dehydrogenase family)